MGKLTNRQRRALAAKTLNDAGGFRRFTVALWGHRDGYGSSLKIVRERIETARQLRQALTGEPG